MKPIEALTRFSRFLVCHTVHPTFKHGRPVASACKRVNDQNITVRLLHHRSHIWTFLCEKLKNFLDTPVGILFWAYQRKIKLGI